MEEVLHAARIADITGFTLPPILVAQLEQLVQAAGPVAAAATADPLLASYSYDLPALLDMLQGMEITPSVAWTDYALHAWLSGGGGGAQLTAAGVRAAVTLLEAIYVPDAEAAEPPPSPPHDGAWRSTSSQGPSPVAAGAAAAAAATAPGESHVTASVRSWLDVCLTALLDGGALTRAHQREDLYDMLPRLATAPSAAVVERLYCEAWPPAAGAAASTTTSASSSSSSSSTASSSAPEHIAAMLWLVASSGAKLPPASINGLLRALEASIITVASNDSSGGSASGSGGGGRGHGGRHAADADAAAASASAAAALNAAFSLPSAPGASGSPPTPPTPAPSRSSSPSPAHGASSSSSFSVPLSPAYLPLFPPFSGAPPSASSSRTAGRRITPYGAYLALWAFHHYRYVSHAPIARVVGPALLSAAVSAGGSGLGPRQRCRVVRAVLMCFGSVPPYLLARYDWSPLFRGWEALGSAELLPLLADVAELARQRRRHRRRRGGVAGGPGSGGGEAQLLQLSHLAAHVVQLPGWQRRLVGVDLTAAVASVAGLLAVLGEEGAAAAAAASRGEEGPGGGAPSGLEAVADAAAAAAARDGDGDGDGYASDVDGDGDAIRRGALATPFAQEVLSGWLGYLLPVIQENIKQITADWGTAGRAASGGGGRVAQQRWGPIQQQQSGQGARYEPYGIGGAETFRPSGSVALAAADAADGGGGAAAAAPDGASWLTPPLTVTVTAAAAPPPPPQMTALELMAALTALRDTAAALDPRVHPALHRTLMWAMQRLGSRAGSCSVDPDAFASVPDMLVRVDALGWVEMPLEWAHSVVQHPDAEGSWFRSLPWPQALRAVLVSGQLVQRARAEVLRRHGADAAAVAAGVTAAAAAAAAAEVDQLLPSPSSLLHNQRTVTAPAPSKAAALLAVSQRLRNHLLGLLAARIAVCTAPELRQLALTWQVYGMPYDKDALATALSALADVAAAAAAAAALAADSPGGGGGSAAVAVTRGPLRDAAARLEMMCEAQQVPREEVDRLFAPLRMYGM